MWKPELFVSLKTYRVSTFLADLPAGLTVGVVALPLAMAFAIACGLPPESGLFTAIVAGFLISALGGSKVQIGGPTGAFVVIVGSVYSQLGANGLVYVTLIAGAILLLMGVARMGALIRFIPFPVVTGFTAGIALVIFSIQIKDLLGLQIEHVPSDFVAKWIAYGRCLDTLDPVTAALGIGTIAIIVLTRRIAPRVPGILVGMILATAIARGFDLDVATIGTRFGDLPRTLPSPSLPSFDGLQWRELLPPAFTIAILAAIESLLSATVADGMTGDRHKPNIELVAQGIANIASVIMGGIPATGAIARTATNIRSGAKTPVAGIIHALTIALLLLFCAPLAKTIPMAALAGILVVVSYNMSEIGRFIGIFKAPRSDWMVLLATFGLTVFVDLTVGVEVGVVLASLLFIRRMAEVSNVESITRELKGDGFHYDDPNAIALRKIPQGVEVFEVQGPFFFGAAEQFKDTLHVLKNPVAVIILRLRQVPAIDATGLHVLREFNRRCKKDGILLILSGVHAQPLIAMRKNGLLDEIGEANLWGNIDDALNRAREFLP